MSPYGFPDDMVKMTMEAAATFKILKSDPDEAVRQREKLFGITFNQQLRQAFLANDGEAVVAMLEAQFEFTPITDKELESIQHPCLFSAANWIPFIWVPRVEPPICLEEHSYRWRV